MAKEGFKNTYDVDITQLFDKTFHTYRRSKTNSEANHWKWNPFNMVNLHYMRNANNMIDEMASKDLLYNIYKSQPNLVLNIGNEYLSLYLMEEFKSKSNLLLTPPPFRILQVISAPHAQETPVH